MTSSIEITDEFASALELLRAGQSVFITGNAGTGKSTLIRYFMDKSNRNIVVAAPTGVAALNVDGYTLHRLFGYSALTTIQDIKSGDAKPGKFSPIIRKLDTLVIDEVSMVRADLFDMVVATLERFGPKPGTPFGGVQLVLVGDLYQLPPVVREDEKEYFKTFYDSPYFFSAHSYSKRLFPTINLTKVFRQLGDDRLVNMLNAIRTGRTTTATLAEINSRTNSDFDPSGDEFWLTLGTTNRIVDATNRRRLSQLPGEAITSFAKISGDTDGFEPPTPLELTFKIGAQVMMLSNDPARRWVNGSIGVITDVIIDEQMADASIDVQVILTTGSIIEFSTHTWDITRPTTRGGTLRKETVGSFTQLPFKLAWAITIHKSQGQTLNRAIIDLSGGTFASGQLYVALSRCKSLEGIVLKRAIQPKDLKTDFRIREFLDDATSKLNTQNFCYLGMICVGRKDGFVRPIEIAVANDEGDVFETLINPTRDIGDAACQYGLSAGDLQAGPTLRQAWPAIEKQLFGRAVICCEQDALNILDTELKRNGLIAPLENILVLAGDHDDYVSAREAALAVRKLAKHQKHLAGCPYISNASFDENLDSFVLARNGFITACGAATDVSQAISTNIVDMPLSERTKALLARFKEDYGIKISYQEPVTTSINTYLTQGIRVCFTGTAYVDNKIYSREEMESIASNAGLTPVSNVSKTRCDILIAADLATLSGKAKKAREFKKPIFSAAEFLHAVEP